MTRADGYVMMLIDLGEYTEAMAWEIYRREIKPLRSIREKDRKCYMLLENRRRYLYE